LTKVKSARRQVRYFKAKMPGGKTPTLETFGDSGGTHVTPIQALVSHQICFEKVAGFQKRFFIKLKMLRGARS
jgi:hypothetical protein